DVEAVAAAAREGRVIAHVDTNLDAADAIAAGAAVLAHPVFGEALDAAGLAASREAEAVHSTVGAFAAVGALLDGTLDLDDPDLIVGDGVREEWAAVRDDPGLLLDGWAEASEAWAAQARENLAALRDAGARVVPASDAGYYFSAHGTALHGELAAMQALGWSPSELLALATVDARAVLGLAGGRVAPGEPADLLILRSDPSVDVAALDDVDAIVLRGRVLARADLLADDLQAAGDPCLEDADCDAGACDRVAHRCAEACAPAYTTANGCGAGAWCMPADGLAAEDGVCHPGDACDLYAQDCSPAYYGQACIPMDVDTSQCWYGGPRGEGDRCGFEAADSCAPGLYCSAGRCARLCDPDAADTCGGALRCAEVAAEDGSPWFGLCL
ncbi:MAG: amidohydrolase family protein, partial [Myxococcota bacterium]